MKNELALFAGAGGGILAGELHGWRTICGVEIESLLSRRLIQRQNEGHFQPFPIWDDVCTFDGQSMEKELLTWFREVFLAKPFSTATHGNATAIDPGRKCFASFGSEPEDLFSQRMLSYHLLQGSREIAETLGYKTRVFAFSAKDLGADHIRKRYWLRAYTDVCSKLRSKEHAEASELPQFCPSIWEGKNRECGIPDGLANRMDRLIAIGNGQVPAVAAAAWTILTQ